jgi:hypothetical protein
MTKKLIANSCSEQEYAKIFQDDNPLQAIPTNIRRNPMPRKQTISEMTRTHAEFIRNLATNTEDYPPPQATQQTYPKTRNKGTLAYSFSDALRSNTKSTHQGKQQNNEKPKIKRKGVQAMVDKTEQNESNKIPNAIQIDDKIKEAVTAQLSDLSTGLNPQQVNQKQVREHVREIMSNSKDFTTILDNYINRINKMKEELPAAQWQEQITNRVATMEQDNDVATKSLQLYEQGLQKVESKMRKTDMISTKAIDKASAVEERMTKMTKEIAEMRERIAELEHKNTHQETDEKTQQLQPIITSITNMEQASKERPTKTQLKATIMKQFSKNAERMETIFNNNMTRLESQTDLAVSMTMYNALTSNKNNATLVEWTTTTKAPPLKGIQPLAFKPEDIGEDSMALFTRKGATTAANNETEETDDDNMIVEIQDQAPLDGQEDGVTKPEAPNV